jgi:hypothetical protein
MLTSKIDLLMKKLENPGLNHLKMADAQVTCEECREMGHMGINCLTVPHDINFIGNSNNGFHPNQGFNARWNKLSFPFDNRQKGGMGQNFNRSEPSLKDIVRDQLMINSEVGKKLLATDKILESIDSKMNNFIVVVQNQLNFNKVLETQIAQLAAALSHPNGGDFPSQPAVPIKENLKAVITQSGKTMAEPKAKSKKMGPIDPIEEEEKAEAEVEAEPRPEKEKENLSKASTKDISDTHLLPFPRQAKKPVEDEKFSHFMEVIRRMYVHILMLDAMQVSTYARYLKDILNQKRPIPKTDMLVFAERCSAVVLHGLPNKIGDPGVLTVSCLIGTQKFDQALCDLRAIVSVMPKIIYDQLNHDSLVPTSMHLELVDQSIRRPVGIVKDILVRIRNYFIPVDFVVLEMDVYRQTPLILGRPFLSTTGAMIDVAAGIIKLNINKKEETFTFKPTGTKQCNQVMVTIKPEWDAMTPDKKPSTVEKFSMKFSRRNKNATFAATSSLVALVT